MQFLFLSPHFPMNYYHFCKYLRELGVTLFGIGDAPYHNLHQELRDSLHEYYHLPDMEDYHHLYKATAYFCYRYGKIDRIESQNEWWLRREAQLRTDFNIYGNKTDWIDKVTKKSEMKKVFENVGIPVAKGVLVHDKKAVKQFIETVGYPVVAKPDCGVGAANIFFIKSENDLENFYEEKMMTEYFMEEYIDGEICTFDGLTNKEGYVVFSGSLRYDKGVMKTVHEDSNMFYYTDRFLPTELEEIGRKAIKAFNIKERFFHLEFFYIPKENRYLGLEINARPPGGLTLDMYNYANDINLYYQYANIMVSNSFTEIFEHPYYCAYIGRKYNKNYEIHWDEVLTHFGHLIVHHQPMPALFGPAMGNYAYMIRTPDKAEMFDTIHHILKLR